MEDWHRVIWIDEFKIELGGTGRREYTIKSMALSGSANTSREPSDPVANHYTYGEQ